MQKIIIHSKYKADRLPVYSSAFASGADLKADIDKPVEIKPSERLLIPTGIYLDIPVGFEAQVRPRSGLAVNYGITVLNSPGTIDSDYRGEIKVLIINLGTEPFLIEPGLRIAQIVFSPVIQAEFVPKKDLSDSVRGEGGFGSTGLA